MARIKITGYVDTDALPAQWVDETRDDGLTSEGWEAVLGHTVVDGLEHEGNLRLSDLDDIEFEKED